MKQRVSADRGGHELLQTFKEHGLRRAMRPRKIPASMKPLLVLLLALSLSPAPAHAAGMGAEEARHLLVRTGFGARLEEIDAFARLSRRDAVERVLGAARTVARTPAPGGMDVWTPPYLVRRMSPEERKAFMRERIERGLALKAWWLNEMLTTDSPLSERMTLFWHNHFTSSLQKVRSAGLMYRQNTLLRKHALGSYADLLHAVAKDPAMLVYLDSATSRRSQPNENFAREVMELFTLGEGNYTERDIKEAARAFTGWSIDRDSGDYLWRPFAHDDGVKTVLGRTGNLRGEDVIAVLLEQPVAAEHVVDKLWREFMSPQPDAAAVKRIAAGFRGSGYQIRVALRELLLSDAFWAPEARGALVKSPVDLVVGTLRQFDIAIADPLPLALVLRNLGQDILSPPNVKGWPGGDAWITSQTLLARKQFVERLMRVDEARMPPNRMEQAMEPQKPMARRLLRAMTEIKFSAGDWVRQFRDRDAQRGMPSVLLAIAPANDSVQTVQGVDLLRSLVADPVYQLK
jgi:uncharacterized protein (DUF1800 family)